MKRMAHRLMPWLHDWVDRPYNSVVPGPKRVHVESRICRGCGRWEVLETRESP